MISLLCVLFASLFSVTLFLLVRTTKNSIQLLDKIDDLEEQLEVSLTILREKHKRLEAKSKIEIFFDDPVVKEVVKDIAECRDVVESIINNFEVK
jgi:hypothetical protein